MVYNACNEYDFIYHIELNIEYGCPHTVISFTICACDQSDLSNIIYKTSNAFHFMFILQESRNSFKT